MACEPFDCDECGETHTKCSKHTVRCPDCNWSGGNFHEGDPCVKCGVPCIRRACRKPPFPEMAVCSMHGGATKTTRDLSAKRVAAKKAEASAKKILEIEGWEPVTDPYAELLNLAGEVLKVRDIFREKVEELTNLKDEGGENIATQIDVLVSAYERALDRSERVLLGIGRLDLDARIAALHARIDANTAELVSSALNYALSKAPVEQEIRDDIMQRFGKRLRQENTPALPVGR